ncbi:uncharacterized protein LOC111397857 [Olea europaea var. sylvestris]|uniref:uncharacterized protein LOC111397857 n=1 Tax=Olea europaea var. sylvestris TaxID=158386 RepID=UPI000C1CF8E6|nr:uncharacterized protein LOC111397857 [Olea europaea var. sylvestris]
MTAYILEFLLNRLETMTLSCHDNEGKAPEISRTSSRLQCFNYKDFDHISSECSSRALVIEEQKDVVDEQQEDQVYKPKFEKFDDFEDTFLFCLRALPICLDIQHVVDLVLDSSLPNLPHYKINHTEHAELQSHAINKSTVKYHFPIPRLDDILDMMIGAIIFSKIDLKSGYNQIRICPGFTFSTVGITADLQRFLQLLGLNPRLYMTPYSFVLKHKKGVENQVIYALSQGHSGQMDTTNGLCLEEGYLFRSNKLCIPRTSVRDFIVLESHADRLVGHFGRNKTIEEIVISISLI